MDFLKVAWSGGNTSSNDGDEDYNANDGVKFQTFDQLQSAGRLTGKNDALALNVLVNHGAKIPFPFRQRAGMTKLPLLFEIKNPKEATSSWHISVFLFWILAVNTPNSSHEG